MELAFDAAAGGSVQTTKMTKKKAVEVVAALEMFWCLTLYLPRMSKKAI